MNFVTEKNLIRLKVGLYGGLLFFSFFVIIAVPVTTNNITFKYCFLYREEYVPGPQSSCHYPVAMAVIFQLFYGLFRLATLILLMVGILNSEFMLFTDILQLIYSAVDVLACCLTFIAACILSVGISATCGYASWGTNDCGWISSKGLGDKDAVSRMHTAEAGAWISFFIWLLLVVAGVFWLFRQGKLPFFSRPAQTDDSATGGKTGATPPMDTPAGAETSRY